jgi:hypothetical protein
MKGGYAVSTVAAVTFTLVLGALTWLCALVATSYNPATVAVGLLAVLVLTGRRNSGQS